MDKLTYTKTGDYYIPNLALKEQPDKSLGKYGRMRRHYLKEHRPVLYNSLLLQDKLYLHLLEVDRTASERLEMLMPQLMRAAGVTEELKAAAPMEWVGLANNCKTQAEEIILAELVYA